MPTIRPARRLVAAAALAFAASLAWSVDEDDSELTISVVKRGAALVVDVSVVMPGPLAATWALMTDFDNAPRFVPNLKSSRVLRREGTVLEVAQHSATTIAFMTFEYGSVRRFELHPMHELRTSLVSGDFKAFQSTMTFAERGDRTLVVYHGEYVPRTAPPPLIGLSIIESHTRKHWRAVIAEQRRRLAK